MELLDLKTHAEIGKAFDLAIDGYCTKVPVFARLGPEFNSFAKTHEVRPVTVQNLCKEIQTYEKRYHTRSASKALSDRNLLISQVVGLYLQGIKNRRDWANESQASKDLREKPLKLQQEVAHLIKEVPDGETIKTG